MCLSFWFAVLTEFIIAFFIPQYRDPFLFDPIIGTREQPGEFLIYNNDGIIPKFVNEAGFVDDEWEKQKPPGHMRIAVLGDSFVEAWQVPNSDDFESKLEKLFKDNGTNVDVLNFGMRGMGTYQEYATLIHYALPYDLDLVIVAAYLSNDVRDNSPFLGDAPAQPYLVREHDSERIIPPVNPARGFPFDFFKRHLHSYRWLVSEYYETKQYVETFGKPAGSAIVPQGGIPAWFEIYHDASQEKKEWIDAWQTTKELFRRIETAASDHSIPLLVLMVPARYEIDPAAIPHMLEKRKARFPEAHLAPYNPTIPRVKGNALFEELSMRVIDLHNEFYNRFMRGEEIYAPGDNQHVGLHGHEVIANILYQTIIDSRLLE